MKGFIIAAVTAGYLMSSSAFAGNIHSLYTDHRAMGVDDILTVIISEEASAGSKSGTQTSKRNDIGVSTSGGTGALSFVPSMGASGGNEIGYDGSGGTSRSGNLSARISARVERVLDNGNLVISGSKVVEINSEKEIIKVSGIVRPQDIESNNVIYSHNIADAQIQYSGHGAVEQASRPGLIARFLNWLF